MIVWTVFIIYILSLLLLDFLVLGKKKETPSVKKAVLESIFFGTNAVLFSGVIYWLYKDGLVENTQNLSPLNASITYLTGYLIELSLSVDNLFVIAVIFTSFKIPTKEQHRLLFLGILGAIVFRALMITVGLVLIKEIKGMNIIFGLFLLFTALKMLKKETEHEQEKPVGGIMRFLKLSNQFNGSNFTININGIKYFTPLFGALVSIELTDLLFALDSIPAIFSLTTDPFLVFSSNIFAILGLRSLYFFLANMLEQFVYLKYSVFSILIFVSIKLITADFYEVSEWFSILFILISLGIGVYVSYNIEKKRR